MWLQAEGGNENNTLFIIFKVSKEIFIWSSCRVKLGILAYLISPDLKAK